MTGFHTQSMITIPLINSEGEALGVLQLINAMDKDGKVIPFDKSLEQIIYAFASQAAITITNMRYQQELIDQMWSFAEALATAIDERTPYNTTHTRQVAKYCGMLADHFNKLYEEGQEKEDKAAMFFHGKGFVRQWSRKKEKGYLCTANVSLNHPNQISHEENPHCNLSTDCMR